MKEWCLASTGWKLSESNKTYDISKIEDTEESIKTYGDKIFYKERWINENGLEQKLIVTYSLKYKNYQEKIRNSQIERARKAINNNSTKLEKSNQNDYKRFIKKTSVTKDGEIAEEKILTIDEKIIEKESQYDGFYGVCTNLDDTVENIIKVNHMRWEIEESFRIMKTEFKSRPVYLSNDDRIRAHFMTCYISLLIHRILEKKLGEEKYTTYEIVNTLRNMNMMKVSTEGYIPTYTRTDLTDLLHDVFGFRTDFEITSEKKMKKILKDLKR